MGLSGKYDFPGIQKVGKLAVKAILASTTWGAWIINSPFKPVFEFMLGWTINWLANKGLVIINLTAIYIDGELDQRAFDQAFDEALEKLKMPGLSDQEKASIDEKIKQAFRNFAHISSKPSEPKPPKS